MLDPKERQDMINAALQGMRRTIPEKQTDEERIILRSRDIVAKVHETAKMVYILDPDRDVDKLTTFCHSQLRGEFNALSKDELVYLLATAYAGLMTESLR